MRAWTPEQLRRFLDHVVGDRLYAAWLLAASTRYAPGRGARAAVDGRGPRGGPPGHATDARDGQGGGGYSEPKTRRSRRTIDLDDVTVEALRGWRELQNKERQAWGAAWKDLGLVFTREDGSAIYPDGWTGTFERHVRQAGASTNPAA
jgi:integrase